MAYTKEEILKERERRRRLKAGIEAEEVPVDNGELSVYEKYLKPSLAGAVQGTVNFGISAANLLGDIHYGKNHPLREMGGHPTIPHLNLSKHLDPEHSRGAMLAGELLAPGGIAAKSIQKISKVPTAFKGILGFAEKTARNAGVGYTFGEQQNEEGDSYGRGISATLSAVIPGLGSITNKAVGKKIVDTFNKDKKELKEGYKKLFDTAKDKGVDLTKSVLSQNDIHEWVKDVPKQYRGSIKRYFADPTLTNTQKAQSDMGAYAAELKHAKDIQGTLPDELQRRLEKLTDKREEMKKEIVNALLANKKTSGLGWKYMDLTSEWAEKLGPHLDVPDINKAVSGKLDPASLAKSLQGKGAEEFRQKMGHQYPEIELNRLADKYLYSRYGAGGLGALGFGGYHFLNSMDKGK